MNIGNITNIKSPITNKKLYTQTFHPVFFVLLTKKYFEVFPKHNGFGFISEL